MTRDQIYTEVYFSENLRKGAKYLLRAYPDHQYLHEDILSDTIIEVFKKSDEQIFDLHSRKKIETYIYFSMYKSLFGRGIKSPQRKKYGLDNIRESDYSYKNDDSDFWLDTKYFRSLMNIEDESPESINISVSEKDYSQQLFGCTTKLNVQFMREIEKADNNKANNIEAWESAQITKLYFEFKSFREVEKATGIGYQQVRNHVKKFISSVTDTKMNVTVVTSKTEPQSGMELYRLHYPYFQGLHQYHSNEVKIKQASYEYIINTPTGALEDDVYVFSRLADYRIAEKVLETGAKLVIDIDDHWHLHPTHPMKNTEKNKQYVSNITKVLPMAHLVTCTTATLWEHLHDEFGINATIIRNSIPEQSQFTTETFKHSKVRFGWVGGLYHTEDLKQVQEGLAKMYSDIQMRNKFQICLGGYNANPYFKDYEKILTNDYKGFSTDTDYIEYLSHQTPALGHIGYNKVYRRLWAKSVSMYGEMYKEFDVSLIPLEGKQANGLYNTFNACKSELKLIESGMTNKAAIVSNVIPYHPHLKHEENCLAIDPKRNDWQSKIRILATDKELRQEIADNLHKYIRKEFDHKKETAKLLNALKNLTK